MTVGEYYRASFWFIHNLPSIEASGFDRTEKGKSAALAAEKDEDSLNNLNIETHCGMMCKIAIDRSVPFVEMVKYEYQSEEEQYRLLECLLRWMSVCVYG